MSLYDRVFFPGRCPECKCYITGFQTKDTQAPALLGVKVASVNSFHTICFCGTYFEYRKNENGILELGTVTITKRRRGHAGHAPPTIPGEEWENIQ